jgi:hypothetical protein
MRARLPTILATCALASGCPGGENTPIFTGDTEAMPDTEETDDSWAPPIEEEVAIVPEWDQGDFAVVLEVGPDQDYASPCAINWSAVQGGTMVRIHWREAPYPCKIAVTTGAYESHPLVITGVPNEEGALPVLTGEDAVTSEDTELLGQNNWLVKLGGDDASSPAAWVWLQSLALTGARSDHAFTDNAGNAGTFADSAAAVRIGHASDVHLVGLEIADSNTGLEIEADARDVVVSGCWLHDNGNTAFPTTANAISEGIDITYEYTRFEPLVEGAAGAALLDRSAGLVVRHNWIEGENQLLALRASDDPDVTAAPGYRETMVYGNVLLVPQDSSSNDVVQFDIDTSASARPGTLFFYHNTVVSWLDEHTDLLYLPASHQHADLRNNLIHSPVEDHQLVIQRGAGTVAMADNWFLADFRQSSDGDSDLVEDRGNATGDDPGFVDLDELDLHIDGGSPCQGIAGQPASETSGHPVEYQYMKHQRRALREAPQDVGAFEG